MRMCTRVCVRARELLNHFTEALSMNSHETGLIMKGDEKYMNRRELR
jgi:hypothetical protein